MLGSRSAGGGGTVGVGVVGGVMVGVTRLGEGGVMFEALGRPSLTASTTPTRPTTSAVAATAEVTRVALVTTVTVPMPGNGE
jgi:hypothetical protein